MRLRFERGDTGGYPRRFQWSGLGDCSRSASPIQGEIRHDRV